MEQSNPFVPTKSLEDLAPFDAAEEIPQQLSTLLTTVRRHLHMHPELGFEEHETSAFIREVLEMHGLEVQGPVAGTGLFVDIEGAHPGGRIGYRADIDALPIQDAKDVPYASRTSGLGHLCGHDGHTAVAIGVALLLHGMRERLHGSVRVFFQPNEEGIGGGAPDMIRDGILEGLAAVYAIHVDPTLPVGRYGLLKGAVTAAADRFRVCVRGQSTGHSARPHQAVDTVWVTTQIANALYQLIGRVTDARNASVLTICRIHGGEAYNVIPEEVELGGTLRSTDNADRGRIKEHIARTARQVGALYGADVEVDVQDGAPPVFNEGRLVDGIARTAEALFGEDSLFHVPRPSMGSEDFAYYLEHVPGVLLRVGTSSGAATSFPLHDAHFDLDEAALAPAAHLMAHVLMRHLREDL